MASWFRWFFPKDPVKDELTAAKAELTAAKDELAAAEANEDPVQIAKAEVGVAEAKVGVAEAKVGVAEAKVRAGAAGAVRLLELAAQAVANAQAELERQQRARHAAGAGDVAGTSAAAVVEVAESPEAWLAYFQGLDVAQVVDVGERLPAPLVDRDNALQEDRVFVRSCYPPLFQALDQYLSSGDRRIGLAVTGSPGTGKTTFRNYVVHAFLAAHQDKQVAVALEATPGKGEPILYVRGPASAGGARVVFGSQSVRAELNRALRGNHAIVRLADVSQGDRSDLVRTSSAVPTVLFSSPNEEAWDDWSRERNGGLFFMPTWSEEELVRALPDNVATIPLMFAKYGGIPRAVLHPRWYETTVNGKIKAAEENFEVFHTNVSTGDPDCTAGVSHHLLHFKVDETTFTNASLEWSSRWLRVRVAKAMLGQVKAKLAGAALTLSTSPRVFGREFEAVAHLSMLHSKVKLCNLTAQGTKGRASITLPAAGEVAYFTQSQFNDDDFQRTLAEGNYMLPYSDVFAAIDALRLVTVGAETYLVLFQMTAAATHPLEGEGQQAILRRCDVLANGASATMILAWVVPAGYVWPTHSATVNGTSIPCYVHEIDLTADLAGKRKRDGQGQGSGSGSGSGSASASGSSSSGRGKKTRR